MDPVDDERGAEDVEGEREDEGCASEIGYSGSEGRLACFEGTSARYGVESRRWNDITKEKNVSGRRGKGGYGFQPNAPVDTKSMSVGKATTAKLDSQIR